MFFWHTLILRKGGAVGSIAASQHQGPAFDPEHSLLPVWSFPCSCVSVWFYHFSIWFPLISQKPSDRLINYSKLPLSVNECVCVRVGVYWHRIQGVFLPLSQFSWHRLWLQRNPDLDKARTNNKCLNKFETGDNYCHK